MSVCRNYCGWTHTALESCVFRNKRSTSPVLCTHSSQQYNIYLFQMISVERVLEYSRLPQEADLDSSPDKKPPPSWPANGTITSKNVSLQYSPGGPQVLKDLTFAIHGREKVTGFHLLSCNLFLVKPLSVVHLYLLLNHFYLIFNHFYKLSIFLYMLNHYTSFLYILCIFIFLRKSSMKVPSHKQFKLNNHNLFDQYN